MTTITISETEYWALKNAIIQLSLKLDAFRLPKRRVAKKGAAQRLHGILAVPATFDYKQVLEDEILKKHLS